MKSIRNLLIGMSCGGGLIFGLHLLHAQEAAMTGTEDVNAMSDEQVLLRAVEMMPTIPADSLPPVGTFYSAQHAPGTAQPWPPLPVNSRQVPVWDMGDGVYLMADEQVDYSVAPLSLMSLRMANGMRTSADGFNLPPGGDFYSDSFNYTMPTNGLWLQMVSASQTGWRM